MIELAAALLAADLACLAFVAAICWTHRGGDRPDSDAVRASGAMPPHPIPAPTFVPFAGRPPRHWPRASLGRCLVCDAPVRHLEEGDSRASFDLVDDGRLDLHRCPADAAEAYRRDDYLRRILSRSTQEARP